MRDERRNARDRRGCSEARGELWERQRRQGQALCVLMLSRGEERREPAQERREKREGRREKREERFDI